MRTTIDLATFCMATLAIAFLAVLAPVSPAAAAGDVAAGKKKAGVCATCHGMDGMSKLPEAPNLAGQNVIYLVKTLGDYKSGARKNEVMAVVATPLSPEDIADLAAFYSSIQITVKPPQ